MKIAAVIPKYGLAGGAERFAWELCERLANRTGFQIHVFANEWGEAPAPVVFHKIPIINFPRFFRPISFAYLVKNRLKKHVFSIVHSHERIFSMDVFTVHGIPHKTWVKETRQKQMGLFDMATSWVEEKGIKGTRAPMLLPVSGLVKEELLKAYDMPESRVHVVHPGIALERFSRLSRESCRAEIRERHGLSRTDLVVLFVGMNFEIKRLDLVLKSVASLSQRGKVFSELKVLIVGKGNTKRYQTMSKELGVSNRIIFVGVTQEIEKYYLASDVFVMPSKFDTFGLAVLEAMAAGLPVIISQKVGARDVVQDGVTGFVLSENPSDSELSRGLNLLINTKTRLTMGENARKLAAQYSWDRTADRVCEIYEQLSPLREL
ncbi:MAG: glycosyltransferase family 4 protein [Desulfobacteraceae bacterium]|jgi:UDP-glucose:(heptosyl)LPS alpha-1,3-glucosyltransferase